MFPLMMAQTPFAVSQITSAVTPKMITHGSSFHSSILKKNDGRLHEKSCISFTDFDSKTKNIRSRNRPIRCVSVQRASKEKIHVSPPSLEDRKEPPLFLYHPEDPYIGTIISTEIISSPTASEEFRHMVIDHGGNVPYWEGQNYGVILPDGTFRLYSLASSRYGDSFNGQTASLCVLNAGSGGTFLSSLKAGDQVKIIGPCGTVLLLRAKDPKSNHIMVATSTGLAPFRGFLRRMFMEDIPTFNFTGNAWLIVGADDRGSVLYDDEFSSYSKHNPDRYQYDLAISSEKVFVQDKISANGDKMFKLLDNGAHIYFCGLTRMMDGILDTFRSLAEQKGRNWDQMLAQLKKNQQWHVEVY